MGIGVGGARAMNASKSWFEKGKVCTDLVIVIAGHRHHELAGGV